MIHGNTTEYPTTKKKKKKDASQTNKETKL